MLWPLFQFKKKTQVRYNITIYYIIIVVGIKSRYNNPCLFNMKDFISSLFKHEARERILYLTVTFVKILICNSLF